MSPPCYPQCLITITFTPGDDTEPRLKHPVTLSGIKSDRMQFNIVLTIGKKTHCSMYNFAHSKQVIVIILPQIPPLQHTHLHMVNWHQLYALECILCR